MQAEHFDYVVIGGGSAGYAAARTARATFDDVAIIDDAAELGGLCILRGCMPSKTLIYSAEVLHLARQAGKFGMKVPHACADMAAIHGRKSAVIEDFASYRRGQIESGRFHLIRDRATFVDGKTLALAKSGRRITAGHFMIATGSVVNTPDIPGLEETPHWTSDDVLDLDFLPESVIVLGAGAVACELAQFLNRVGTRVIQIQRSPRILKQCPPEAAGVVARAFRDEGIELHTGTHLVSVERHGDGVLATFTGNGGTRQARAAHLFNALGRKPNTRRLGLAAAGVETHSNGQVRVNGMQQTTNPRIYAAGDVASPHEIVHIAIMQAEVAARHACGESPDPVNYDTRTGVVFTDPQVATAGIPLGEAAERGIETISAGYPFNDHGKSILMEAKYGYVKTWADRATGKLIGAECVGKDAGELIHAMAVGISTGASPADLLKVHWYHPTLSEIWSYPLEDLADKCRQAAGVGTASNPCPIRLADSTTEPGRPR
jgi:pyruvate/2-oxoglutarate dehydrogenase complex dihydrolipoamide dehydrogenase (E3) component